METPLAQIMALNPLDIVQATVTPETSDTDPIEQTEDEVGSIQSGDDSEVNSELSDTEVSPIFEMVSVLGADDFDPLGDGVEHPELIDNLLDEDPETIWYSETYANRSMGGLKDGVGVVIELRKPYELSEWQLKQPIQVGPVKFLLLTHLKAH